MRREKASPKAPIYQLKVTLTGIRPPIWRRLQVPGNVTLGELHRILQTAMGWNDHHLHAFEIGGRQYGVRDPELELHDETKVKLNQQVPEAGARFQYEYDFGDGWDHRIDVEKIMPPEDGVRYPRCVTGRRCCPPEDVGGPYGYEAFLEAISDPGHEEHESLREWIGYAFDPDEFDAAQINDDLNMLGGTGSPWTVEFH